MSVPEWMPAGDGETVVWQGQPRRRIVLLGGTVGVLLALVVAAGAYVVASIGVVPGTLTRVVGVLLALVVFGVVAGGTWLWRWATQYVLTDVALYHRTGVLTLTVTELRLEKVQNTSYAQGIAGTVLDYGTITVETAGSDGAELTLRQLDDPRAVHQRIAKRAGQARGDRDDGMPGSLAEWRAVRAEVKRIRTAIAGDR